MRFFYADAGLRTNAGHHASACRLTLKELKRHGIAPQVFGAVKMESALQAELGAAPLFRYSPYSNTDDDLICGWLNAFDLGTKVMRADLDKLPAMTQDDLLFVGTVSPPLLMGIAAWLASLAPARRPVTALDLGTDSGLEREPAAEEKPVFPRDPRIDARAAFYRFAAARIPKDARARIHMFYFDTLHARLFGELMDFPVRPMPMFYEAYGAPRRRTRRDPVTVAVLGHQQPYKGYQHVPEIARRLLAARADCRLLVHNSGPERMMETQKALQAMATAEKRLTLAETAGTQDDWARMVDVADIILCPYDPRHYSLMPSGIASEAAANAVPMVVPAWTALHRFVDEYGGFGATFDRWEPDAIAAATIKAIDDFDTYAGRAYTASQRWAENGGPRRAVELILACAEKR